MYWSHTLDSKTNTITSLTMMIHFIESVQSIRNMTISTNKIDAKAWVYFIQNVLQKIVL